MNGIRRATAAVTVLVMAGALAGCGGGRDSEETDSQPPAASSVRQITVGGTPAGIATGESGVWVADNLDGSLVRLDPRHPRSKPHHIPVPGGPASVAVGEDGVWVASGDGSITKVDPRTEDATRLDLRVSQPGGITVGEGSVWVTSSAANAVVRIDPASGRTIGKPIAVGEFPTDIAVGAGSIWVANTRDGTVSRVDPETAEAEAPIGFGEDAQVLALAFGEGGVWIAHRGESPGGRTSVSRIDPDSSEVDDASASVDAGIPVRIAAGEGGVWVTLVGGVLPRTSKRTSGVSLIDPATGEVVVARIQTGQRPSGVATGKGAVWVADAGDGTVARIQPGG